MWHDPHGESHGFGIEPLYKNQVNAAKQDTDLYLMLALIDVVRVGKVRELKVALTKLN